MQALLIRTRTAGVDRLVNLLLACVVLLALVVAWTGQGATVPSLLALVALMLMSAKLPGLLGGARRAGTCKTGSLCAQTKVSYHRPAWLCIDETGDVQVLWRDPPGSSSQNPPAPSSQNTPGSSSQNPPGNDAQWLPAQSFQTLQLGQLVQITVVTRHPDIDPPRARPSQPVAVQSMSTQGAGHALDSPEASWLESLTQQGSCILWLPRLPAHEAAALRRWLLWQKRGGRADPAR